MRRLIHKTAVLLIVRVHCICDVSSVDKCCVYAVLANISTAWLVGEPAWHQMVLDICCSTACSASNYTHLHGSANYSRHRQPQGKQTRCECLSSCLLVAVSEWLTLSVMMSWIQEAMSAAVLAVLICDAGELELSCRCDWDAVCTCGMCRKAVVTILICWSSQCRLWSARCLARRGLSLQLFFLSTTFAASLGNQNPLHLERDLNFLVFGESICIMPFTQILPFYSLQITLT